MMKRVILFDNYDSFTHNLFHLLEMVRPNYQIEVVRNRNKRILQEFPDAFIIGPGPMTPSETGLLSTYFDTVIKPQQIPVFGVCLGMQYLGFREGIPVERSLFPVHGAAVKIHHVQKDIFTQIPQYCKGARYNSLEIQASNLAPHKKFQILAVEESIQSVMALKHTVFPWVGVQFHPESFLTEFGNRIVNNFFTQYVEN